MKILFFAPIASIHSKRWIQYFVDKGYEIHVLVTDNEKNIDIPNACLHYLVENPSRIRLIRYIWKFTVLFSKIRALVREINPDIIHLHWLAIHGYAVAKIGFHPLVATPWGSDLLVVPKKHAIYRYIVKYIIKRSDIFTCDAEHMKEVLVGYGATKKNVHLINFGTDTLKFNPEKKDHSLKTRIGFDADVKLIISLRALKPIYDISTFINAIPEVIRSYTKARFVVVGSGEEEEKLKQLAMNLEISKYVHFAGRLSDEDMQRYTASADIYVSTSLSDGGLAASTAEAMASEVPVVISDFGDNREWVENGKSGFLFPLKDHKRLAEKILYLLNNPDTAKKTAKAGRDIIENKNNWYREMEKVNFLYEHLAKSNKEI
jgi:L-malate glycosyltransferase